MIEMMDQGEMVIDSHQDGQKKDTRVDQEASPVTAIVNASGTATDLETESEGR